MAIPKIVYCSNNHIYDMSMHEQCPYCSKIAEDQKRLNEMVGVNTAMNRSVEENDETTELLRYEEEDDGATELLRYEEEDDGATELLRYEEEDDGATELLWYNPNDSHENKEERSYVVGWLVGLDGYQKGRSIEITQEKNYIYWEKECIEIRDKYDNSFVGKIYQNKSDKNFYIEVKHNFSCMVNGKIVEQESMLRPYDLVTIQGKRFRYVEIINNFIEWGM